MQVYLSEKAKEKLEALTKYLVEEWSYKVKEDFKIKLSVKIRQIATHPESCPKSTFYEAFHRCLISKQTAFFYRVDYDKDEIEIITIFDTRQKHPKSRD